MALRRRFRPVFLKHAPRGMARFAKPLQGPFGLAAKHSQKHKNRPKIGRFSHFNPSAEMHPFSPFSASKAPEKWLCDAICRKKQLFAGSFVSRSHSFCSFTAGSKQKYYNKKCAKMQTDAPRQPVPGAPRGVRIRFSARAVPGMAAEQHNNGEYFQSAQKHIQRKHNLGKS